MIYLVVWASTSIIYPGITADAATAVQVMEDNEVESRKARVQLILDEEALMSESDLNNPEYFPEFIEVLTITQYLLARTDVT